MNLDTCATMLPEWEGRKPRWLTVARPKETGALLSDVSVAIHHHEGDIVIARQKRRELAASRGFSSPRGATFYFTLDGRR